jgi:hypothetical protein
VFRKFKIMHLVVLECKQGVNRLTIRIQLYTVMIHSATCFEPMKSPSGRYLKLSKEVYTAYYGTEISLLTCYVTIQFLYIQFRIKFFWQ